MNRHQQHQQHSQNLPVLTSKTALSSAEYWSYRCLFYRQGILASSHSRRNNEKTGEGVRKAATRVKREPENLPTEKRLHSYTIFFIINGNLFYSQPLLPALNSDSDWLFSNVQLLRFANILQNTLRSKKIYIYIKTQKSFFSAFLISDLTEPQKFATQVRDII